MSGLGAVLALAILLAWTLFALLNGFLGAGAPIGLGALAGLLMAILMKDTVAVSGAIALLAPFGVMVPALAMRHMANAMGADIPGFSLAELAVFTLLYTGFLATAFGVIPVDLYRFGYAPVPVGLMVLALCGYAFLTGNWFLAGIMVLAQLAWMMGWGSSNWLDHVLHVLMWPVALVTLFTRLW